MTSGGETGVCAIVVTYHPEDQVLENLRAVRPQVEGLVVVDNGSTLQELGPLRGALAALGGKLLENGENEGIATALNQGVQHAVEHGFERVLLLDQDSAVTDGYVAAMAACFDSSSFCDRLAILVPRYIDRRFGSVLPGPRLGSGEHALLEAATTSGSLMPVSIFRTAGMFAEELFIDGVDYEYSLRVRALGYQIAECRGATLLHSPATPTFHRVPGFKPFQAGNYSPVRRYYQERNKIWVAKRYGARFPRFLLQQFGISAKDLAKIVLVESDRWRKVRFFFRGILHGLLGRSGKMPAG